MRFRYRLVKVVTPYSVYWVTEQRMWILPIWFEVDRNFYGEADARKHFQTFVTPIVRTVVEVA